MTDIFQSKSYSNFSCSYKNKSSFKNKIVKLRGIQKNYKRLVYLLKIIIFRKYEITYVKEPSHIKAITKNLLSFPD